MKKTCVMTLAMLMSIFAICEEFTVPAGKSTVKHFNDNGAFISLSISPEQNGTKAWKDAVLNPSHILEDRKKEAKQFAYSGFEAHVQGKEVFVRFTKEGCTRITRQWAVRKNTGISIFSIIGTFNAARPEDEAMVAKAVKEATIKVVEAEPETAPESNAKKTAPAGKTKEKASGSK